MAKNRDITLTTQYRRNLERAKHMKYIKTTTRRKDAFENAFFEWCVAKGYPCVKLTLWPKHATIDIKLDATDLIFTDELTDTVNSLYAASVKKKNLLAGSEKYMFLDKVPLRRADDLVSKLLAVLPFN